MVCRTNLSVAIITQEKAVKLGVCRWVGESAYTIPLIQCPGHHVLVIDYQTVKTQESQSSLSK